ncbi:uncharacterized protein LOC116292760, partial [Actinia tenebrosa]|uniref:Uncharacterized protein LOC116292760 n=1 Tax=Actinia tenebrosa TaxID=6105 RepID=A0A6P8HJF2_ACTTE
IDDLKSAPLGEKGYNQLLYDWFISDKDIKTQLQEVKAGAADIKSDTGDLKSDTADLKSDTADLKSYTEDIKSETALIPGIREDISHMKNFYSSTQLKASLINQLTKSDFNSLIKFLCKSFHPNTRQWVLDEVKTFVYGDESQPCEMIVITAGPGMGKSTIAAKICQTYKELGCLAGCHFFQFSNSTRNDPRLLLQSIASQMCDTVPGYGEALERKLHTNLGKDISDMDCEGLFTVLLEEPCQKLKFKDSFVFVLDAIDECCSNLKHELQDILKNKLSLLPSWLRFVITTRPPPSFNAIKAKKSIFIDPRDPKNKLDIEVFFRANLRDIDEESRVMEQLVKVSGGLFLVAFFLIDEMQRENIFSPSELMVIFPRGLSSVYEKYFERLRTVLLPYITEEEGFFRMLEAVVASKNPIPLKMMYSILGLKSVSEILRGKRKTRSDALSQLHSLFPVENDHVSVFHKTVVDFLILEEKEQDFNISVGKMSKNGGEKLSDEAAYIQGVSIKVPDSRSHEEGESLATRNEKRDHNKPLNTVCTEEPPKNHDFEVSTDDGNKVLVNQCYEVLSDILNGKKDLNKPLDLTDSEEYALRFAWLPSTDTLLTKEKNYQKLRNYYTFVAYTFSDLFNKRDADKISDKLLRDTISQIIGCFKDKHDKESCPFRTNPNFGCCIEMVLNAVCERNGSETETSQNPLTVLKKHNLSYFLRESIAVDPRAEENQTVSQTLACENGFVLSLTNGRNTEIHMYQLNGTYVAKTSFQGNRKIILSSNYRFIVVIEEMVKGEIEILDATTLDLVSSFQSPNVIRSYHVYGNQPWYIVIRCFNNKIYVMEGETGQMSSAPIAVDQYVDVIAVSALGHILLGETWKSSSSKNAEAMFTDDDGNFLEEIHWQWPVTKTVVNNVVIRYHRLILFHLPKSEKRVPIYPRKTNHCTCSVNRQYVTLDCGSTFSDDGELLAFIYKCSIFIFETSSNSLYQQVYIGPGFAGHPNKIVFFSATYVVISNSRRIAFINIKTNKIEHRFFMQDCQEFHFVPRKQGEPFTLIGFFEIPSLTKYELYNLM